MFKKKPEIIEPRESLATDGKTTPDGIAVGMNNLKDYQKFSHNLSMRNLMIQESVNKETAALLSGKKNQTDMKPILIYGSLAIVIIIVGAVMFMNYQDTNTWIARASNCEAKMSVIADLYTPGVKGDIIDSRIAQMLGKDVTNETATE